MKTFIATSFVLLSLTCCAQRDNNSMSNLSFTDRLYFGGDITLSISGSATIIGAAPMLGYRITENWSAGIGISAYYFNVRQSNYSTFYGGNVFSRYLITENIFAQSEYHMINTEVDTIDEIVSRREYIPLLYVGGGYRYPLGGNGYASVTALYDLIGNPHAPYPNPTIRVGVNFGFN